MLLGLVRKDSSKSYFKIDKGSEVFMKLKQHMMFILGFLIIVTLAACQTTTAPVSISLDQNNLVLEIGDTTQLTATVTGKDDAPTIPYTSGTPLTSAGVYRLTVEENGKETVLNFTVTTLLFATGFENESKAEDVNETISISCLSGETCVLPTMDWTLNEDVRIISNTAPGTTGDRSMNLKSDNAIAQTTNPIMSFMSIEFEHARFTSTAGSSTVLIEISNNGIDWETIDTLIVSSYEESEIYKISFGDLTPTEQLMVNDPSGIYIRLYKTGGNRMIIDNLMIYVTEAIPIP